jgi:hypothetical protein
MVRATALNAQCAIDGSGQLAGHTGKASALIRGAKDPQEIIAFLMEFDGRYLRSETDSAVAVAEVLEGLSPHCAIVYNVVRMEPFKARSFLSTICCKQVADEPPAFVWVSLPVPSHRPIVAHSR